MLISAPVDADFELFTLACTVNLLNGLLTSRFTTTLDEDLKIVNSSNLPYKNKLIVSVFFNVLAKPSNWVKRDRQIKCKTL